MGDTPDLPPEEPTTSDKVTEAVTVALEHAAKITRVAIAGDQYARVRRKVLFVIAAVGIAFPGIGPLTFVGLVAVLLLAMTDDVVDLS